MKCTTWSELLTARRVDVNWGDKIRVVREINYVSKDQTSYVRAKLIDLYGHFVQERVNATGLVGSNTTSTVSGCKLVAEILA